MYAKRHRTNRDLALRARIVLACASGKTNQEVAAVLRLNKDTVGKWRRRFVAQRLEGLLDEPRPGAPRQISDKKIEDVVVRTLESTPKGRTHWSTRKMASASGLSPATIGRIWRTFGLKPHIVEGFKLSNDPQFIEKVRDIVGLYLSPPRNAVVFAFDEKPQVQALQRAQPILPMSLGSPEKRTGNYLCHGTLDLFAAIDVATGRVVAKCKNQHRAKDFVDFLRELDRQVEPELELHLILDNLSAHKAEEVHRFLLRNPRFHLHFTPTYSSWLNLVERFFSSLTQEALKRGSFTSIPTLRKAIYDYVDTHNEEGISYRWTKTADQILDSVGRFAVPDSADVNVVSAPRYYDYQVLASYQPSGTHDLRGFFFGADDTFRLLFENPSEFSTDLQSGNFSLGSSFQRGYITYSYTPSERFSNRLLMSAGRDQSEASLGTQLRFVQDVEVYQLRNASDWKVSDGLTVRGGLDLQLDVADVDVRAPQTAREGENVVRGGPETTIEASIEDYEQLQVAPWLEAEIRLFDDRLKIIPGLRIDYFGQVPAERWSADPRIVVRYQFIQGWTAKAGIGAVHQPPTLQDLNEDFGNPNLKLQSGLQYSLGMEWRPEDHIRFDVTGFYKDLNNQVSRTTNSDADDGPVLLDNDARGRVFGLEVFLKHSFKNNFNGWLSYTLSRAERQDEPGAKFRLFDFDQTHILTLVASYVLPYSWEVGIRWRVATGNTITMRGDALYDSDEDVYVPVPGENNGDRIPMFHQLDIRIDKTWVFERWTLSAYLTLANAYNRQNVEGFTYNFDFTTRSNIPGLPILPAIGLKGQW